MNRQYVSSSTIISIGYDDISDILEIEFKNGKIYQYIRVPKNLYEGLMNTDSKGSYLDKYIKKAGYPYKEI